MKTLVLQSQGEFNNPNLPIFDSFMAIAERGLNEPQVVFRFTKIDTTDDLIIKCGDNAHFTINGQSENLGQELNITSDYSSGVYNLVFDNGYTTAFALNNPQICNMVNSQLMLERDLSNLPSDTFINATYFYGMLDIVGSIADLAKMPKIKIAFLQFSQIDGTLESLADALKGSRENGSTLAVTGNNLVTYNGVTFNNVVKTISFDGAGGYTVS